MEDIGQEYTELADAVMLNGGAPVKTPLLQLIEDRSVSLFFKASLKLLFRLFYETAIVSLYQNAISRKVSTECPNNMNIIQ